MSYDDHKYSRAAVKHISRYIKTGRSAHLKLAGEVIRMATDQAVALELVAQRLVSKPLDYLDHMIRALEMTDRLVEFDMRRRVMKVRSARHRN